MGKAHSDGLVLGPKVASSGKGEGGFRVLKLRGFGAYGLGGGVLAFWGFEFRRVGIRGSGLRLCRAQEEMHLRKARFLK